MDLDHASACFRYSDWANQQLLIAAAPLPPEALDRRFDMGVGSLRRTLLHIYNGEFVWLRRCQNRTETPWPSEDDAVAVSELKRRFAANSQERADFLNGLDTGELRVEQVYRDSRGSLYRATLFAMLIQGFLHSHHHRAQAANMLRSLGAGLVELDFMMIVRAPVE